MDRRTKTVLHASIAGLMAAAGVLVSNAAAQTEHDSGETGKTVPCYGINKCQGVGACGGKGHGCAGANACKGQGYLELSEDTCLKIEGGRLTEEPDAA